MILYIHLYCLTLHSFLTIIQTHFFFHHSPENALSKVMSSLLKRVSWIFLDVYLTWHFSGMWFCCLSSFLETIFLFLSLHCFLQTFLLFLWLMLLCLLCPTFPYFFLLFFMDSNVWVFWETAFSSCLCIVHLLTKFQQYLSAEDPQISPGEASPWSTWLLSWMCNSPLKTPSCFSYKILKYNTFKLNLLFSCTPNTSHAYQLFSLALEPLC